MIAQIGIGVFGMASIWLANCETFAWRRWAAVCGLAAQPFWCYETFTKEQWGIFAISFVYLWSWFRGLRRDWWGRAT